MSKDKPLSFRVAALSESFLASVVGAPPSLQAAVIDVEVDKLRSLVAFCSKKRNI